MIHVFPLNDLQEHDTSGKPCWCDPTVEWGNPATGEFYGEALIIHCAADHREIIEQAEEIIEGVPI